MIRIIYVSLAADYLNPESVVQEIVKNAKLKNRTVEVTGALIYTGRFFAQAIEGRVDQVRTIYSAIEKDVRHSGIKLLANEEVNERSFKSWSLAYSGLATYISEPIEKILCNADADGDAAKKVTKLLLEFAKGNRNSL